jgi:hypothetical protein
MHLISGLFFSLLFIPGIEIPDNQIVRAYGTFKENSKHLSNFVPEQGWFYSLSIPATAPRLLLAY